MFYCRDEEATCADVTMFVTHGYHIKPHRTSVFESRIEIILVINFLTALSVSSVFGVFSDVLLISRKGMQ